MRSKPVGFIPTGRIRPSTTTTAAAGSLCRKRPRLSLTRVTRIEAPRPSNTHLSDSAPPQTAAETVNAHHPAMADAVRRDWASLHAQPER